MKLGAYFTGGLEPGAAKAQKVLVPDTNLDLSGLRNLSISGAFKVADNANSLVPVNQAVVQNAITSAGAIGVATYNTTINSTSGALALTLASGAFPGQKRRVQMIVDNGDATLTFNTNATIVFADVGDVAELQWTGTAWVPIALYNCADGATAPVYTAAS